jgi:arsenite methyltransferase
MNDRLRDQVRDHYAAAATNGGDGCGCSPQFYGDEAPEGVLSLGCGNPLAIAELREGETVLDLGSGAGLDVMLSAKRVGPTGLAWGLDMTEEMLALARRNAAGAGVSNAHFLKGHIEEIPLPAESVDVVISNCVINLSTDKPAVFRELARVLKPGGRLRVSDIVAEDRLSPAEREERGSYAGCVAGALAKGEYVRLLEEAGFEDVSVELKYEAADGIHGASIRATKPASAARPKPLPLVASGSRSGCC